jgi:hypothetical protein
LRRELSAADIQLSFVGELAVRFGIDGYPTVPGVQRFQARPA